MMLLAATVILDIFRIDLTLADRIYQLQGDNWSLKDNWLLEGIIHKGGRTFVGALVILNLTALVATYTIPAMAKFRRSLVYLLVAVIVSLVIVSGLKAVTHIDCPWSFQRFGGDNQASPVFSDIFGSGTGRCFPAGHASGGYAWVALYFVCLLYWPRWRFFGLAFALLLGGIFGISQQLRGAHLLSHDIWTLAICWFTPLTGYIWLQRPAAMRSE